MNFNRFNHKYVPEHQFLNTYTAPWQKATIHNLETISESALLYTILSHLKKQNKRCLDADSCLYRLEREDGQVLKCAAGVLIPDYNKSILFKDSKEKTTLLNQIGWLGFLKAVDVSENHSTLIQLLQSFHDKNEKFTFYPTQFRFIRNRLTHPDSLKILKLFIEKEE